MKRVASSSLVALLCTAVASAAFAQAKPAAPTTPEAPVRAKFATPIKGDATVQVIAGNPTRVNKEIVTKYRVKNISSGPIALLKVDQYWYSKEGKMVSATDARHKQPFQPGEVIEITTRAPDNPGAARNQTQFSHANGKVNAKPVKQFN